MCRSIIRGGRKRASGFSGMEWWTGTLEWTGIGMMGMVGWNIK